MIYLTIGACLIIAAVCWYIAHILKKNGKQEHEIKQWRKHSKTLETMRQNRDYINNMSDNDVLDIVRKNSRP